MLAAIKAETQVHREAKEAAHAEIAAHDEYHADMHAEHVAVLQEHAEEHASAPASLTSVLGVIERTRQQTLAAASATTAVSGGGGGTAAVAMPVSAPNGFHFYTPPSTEARSVANAAQLAIMKQYIGAATMINRFGTPPPPPSFLPGHLRG
eukprot:COSAG01_NODE_38_length_33931_cov_75.163632_21_plen_151_part_00